jgi:ABC-type branched-subunit amino acid transport system substrate-binding protein
MRISLLGLLLLALPAVAADLYIGQSAPLSGNNADLGNDIKNGAKAWFKKVNDAGGINGNKIVFVTIDDRNDAALTGEITKKLAYDYGSVALFGYVSATASLAAMPTVAGEKIPFFAPFTGDEALRSQNEFIYTLRPTYEEETEKIIASWGSINHVNITVLHYDDVVGKRTYATVAAALQKAGKKPTGVAIKRGADNIATGIQQVIGSNPQAIIIATQYGPAAALVKQMKALNKQVMVSSLSFAGASQIAKALGPDAAGISVALSVPPPKSTTASVVKECSDAWAAYGQKDAISAASLEACIAAKVLTEGIKKAGATVTRETLNKALSSLTKVDVGGFGYEFKPGNRNGSKYVDVVVIRQNGDLRN